MNKKNDIVLIYDETAENIEDKILKIFKKYLEEEKIIYEEKVKNDN